MKNNIITMFLLAATLFAACKKEPVPDTPSTSTAHAYLLNEGSWGGNDAGISLLDRNSDKVEINWFRNNNGRGIGDLAQDLIHYGGKLYASVHTSNTIEVINPATGKSIKQIDMGTRGPRYLASHNGKVYVSCYDKTIVRIDTATLAIEASCPLSGMQPEQLCIIGDTLYVCNCWQYDANGTSVFDSTVSVVDINTFSETRKITVAKNPGRIKAIDSHRFIVACAGDYGNSPAQTLIVDPSNGRQQPLSVPATSFDIADNTLYLYQTTYDAQGAPQPYSTKSTSPRSKPHPSCSNTLPTSSTPTASTSTLPRATSTSATAHTTPMPTSTPSSPTAPWYAKWKAASSPRR